jgi:hypothetical protein
VSGDKRFAKAKGIASRGREFEAGGRETIELSEMQRRGAVADRARVLVL